MSSEPHDFIGCRALKSPFSFPSSSRPARKSDANQQPLKLGGSAGQTWGLCALHSLGLGAEEMIGVKVTVVIPTF